MKKKRIVALALALLLLCTSAFAEGTEFASGLKGQMTLEEIQALNGEAAKTYFENDKLYFLEGTCTAGQVKNAEDAGQVVASMIGLLGGDETTHFEPLRTLNDANGNVYYVFQQTYADMIVLGGAVKVITDKYGKMLGLVGSVASELPEVSELESQLTAEQAEALVIQHEIDAHRGTPEIMAGMTQKIVLPVERELDMEADEVYTRFVWAVYTNNPNASIANGTELPYLAHYVTLAGEYLYSLPTILPGDAAAAAGYNAEYIFQFMEPVEYTGYVDLADGTEQEITVTLMRDSRTGMYYLGNIEHKIVVADCWEFLYNGGRVVVEYSPDNLEWDQVGLLSLYNYCRAYDYYKGIGWEGGDGEGTPILVLKDFCDINHKPIDNAAYAGKFYGWQCFLSSAANNYSQCLDVCSHEFTHCVTQSVMTYNAYMNDYGAINEAISDIQGNLCEMMLGATSDTNWEIAESVEAIRSMSDPHRYQQPAYSWDLYYQANVKTPTEVNDRGGVHTNSSLLNHLAYLLFEEGGMTLEEARAFWFAVDCAMVPGTDYAQLRELLPWVLRLTGLTKYQEALEKAINDTRLGDSVLPETLDDSQVMLTLNLPDNETFNDGNWMLGVFSINVELLTEKMNALVEKIANGDTAGLPTALAELVKNSEAVPEPTAAPEEEPNFLESLGKKLNELLSLNESKPEPENKEYEMSDEELDELLDWISREMQGVAYSGNSSAGQDGHTVTMMGRPGYTVPYLLYLRLVPGTMDMEQMNMVVYLNHQWIDLTGILDTGDDELGRVAATIETLPKLISLDLIANLFGKLFGTKSWTDVLDVLALNVPGGQPFEIPNDGLENVDFTYNMAMEINTEVNAVNRKSRPKLPTAQDMIEEMVVNFGAYGEEAEAQNDRLMIKLNELDPDAASKWESIMGLWQSVNNDLSVHMDVLPDGLPDTDELCLVALGFQLNPDGSMKDELVERLNVLLQSAQKYPNALIVCTGGGTAAENENATEAGEMAKWLIDHGVDEKRVIVEDKSLTTAQNAIYTYDILTEQYPQVKQLAIVSSDYHIATGALLFGAEAILRAETIGEEKLAVVSNAAYKAPSGTLSTMFQAGALIELSGDVETAFEIYYDTYDIHELPQVK